MGIEWMRHHPSCRAVVVVPDAARADAVRADARVLGVPALEVVVGALPGVLGGSREVAAFALISLSLVFAALLGLALARGGPSWAGVAITLALAWRVLPAFWGAYQNPAPGPIRHAIRTGVLSLVLVDAAIGAIFGGALFSVVILATGLLAASLARLFAVT